MPPGCELHYEVQPSGGAWTPVADPGAGNDTILVNQPALLNFRAVFVGSKDIMPAVMISGSRVKVSRPRTDFVHVSEAITLAAATQSIKVSVLLESYVEANHDATCLIDDVCYDYNEQNPNNPCQACGDPSEWSEHGCDSFVVALAESSRPGLAYAVYER